MFHDNQAFASFSVDDQEAAKAFYGSTLGLEASNEYPGGLTFKLGGGGSIYVYVKPNHEPASFTVLNFMVSDIKQAVDALAAKGVSMEHYDLPDIKTDAQGISDTGVSAPAIAWFKDPAGNVLAIVQTR